MKKVLLIALACFTVQLPSRAVTILGFDVAGEGNPVDTTLAATTIASNLQTTGFNTLSRTGVGGVPGTNAFNSDDWNIGTFSETNDYIGFSLRSATGYTLDVTSVSFAVSGSSDAPRTFRMGYRVGGVGSFTLSSNYTITGTVTSRLWDFSDFSASSSQAVEFRFYGFGAQSVIGTFSRAIGAIRLGNLMGDDLVLGGTVTPVPEPHEYGIALVAMMVVLVVMRRQRSMAS